MALSKWDKITANLDTDNNTKSESRKTQRILRSHFASIADTKRRFSNASSHQFIQSIIDETSALHLCTKSLDDLKPIRIWQLRPNTIHYGYKLIARIVTPPDKLLSFRTIIKDVDDDDDDNGSGIMELSIYNLIPFQITLSDVERSGILSKGSIIAIKEPYCKFYKSQTLGLRVDNPFYNLLILETVDTSNSMKSLNHKMNAMTTEQLKSSGNHHFKQKQYRIAVLFYSKAIASAVQSDLMIKLLLNRSLCYLRMNELYLAHIDAERAYKMDESSSLKTMYRILSTLNRIGRVSEAATILEGIDWVKVSKSKSNTKSIYREFMTLKGIINRRHHESQGIFNSVSYQLMANDPESVMDYIGNIEVQMIDSKKGRGIVATEDIKRGELILIERAFSFGNYRNDRNEVFIQRFDEQCSTAYSGRNQELILDSISKCTMINWKEFNRPHLERGNGECSMESVWNKWRFMQLYDGNKESMKMSTGNMMEIFRNRNLSEILNDEEMERIRRTAVSAKWVNDVIISNAFETLRNPKDIVHFLGENNNEEDSFDVLKNERFCGSGLFIIGSLFNHCSKANAKRIMFNQHMVIKAECAIKAGEEVTISYIEHSDQFDRDQQELQNWGIQEKDQERK